jgi:hypothetical protein
MTDDEYGSLEEWLASRPECVHDADWTVIGYTEDDCLIVGPSDCETYGEALEQRETVHAHHFREQ